MKTNGKTTAFVRLMVTVVLVINGALTFAGKNPIPFDEELFTEVITEVAAGLSILWIWWKDNNTSEAHCKKQGLADIAKGKILSNVEVEDIYEEDVYDNEDEYDEEEEG